MSLRRDAFGVLWQLRQLIEQHLAPERWGDFATVVSYDAP